MSFFCHFFKKILWHAEAAVDENDENESDNATKEGAKDVSESVNELKEEETTQAVEVTSEQPRGLGKWDVQLLLQHICTAIILISLSFYA